MAAIPHKDSIARKWHWKKKVHPKSPDPEEFQEENISDIQPESSECIPLDEAKRRREDKVAQQRIGSMFKGFFRVSTDSKLAQKLYGSQKALQDELDRQRRSRSWIIHPLSSFRRYWDLLMLVLLVFLVTTLPVSIAFYEEMNPGWLTANIFTDLLFILDIVVNFRTGIITSESTQQTELVPKKIAKRYLKGWFIVDLISSVPFDYVTLFTTTSGVSSSLVKASRAFRIVRLTKLLSLLRLLRLSRLMRYLQRWEDVFPSLARVFNVAGGVLRISKLIALMLMLAHWNGCIQFLVPVLQDIPDNSWIAINRLQNADVFEQYSWSLFKAISHMLCIGFGRWPPQNITEVWLTIISMTIGALFYALYIGNMSDLILSIDYSGRIYSEKLNQIEEYMRYRKLPQVLRHKVFEFYEHRYQRKYFDEDAILGSLSPGLKEEIIAYNCQKLVKSVPFFENAHPEFVSDVITKLKFEVFLKEEFIVKAGTVGTKMYFIQSGLVDILTEDGDLMTKLGDGSHFGEICLLTRARRVASVRAATTLDLFSLSSEHFCSILQEYPEMKQTMETVALERLNKMGMAAPPILSSDRDDEGRESSLAQSVTASLDGDRTKHNVNIVSFADSAESSPTPVHWSSSIGRSVLSVNSVTSSRRTSILSTGRRTSLDRKRSVSLSSEPDLRSPTASLASSDVDTLLDGGSRPSPQPHGPPQGGSRSGAGRSLSLAPVREDSQASMPPSADL